jgi:hypothetical protein
VDGHKCSISNVLISYRICSNHFNEHVIVIDKIIVINRVGILEQLHISYEMLKK